MRNGRLFANLSALKELFPDVLESVALDEEFAGTAFGNAAQPHDHDAASTGVHSIAFLAGANDLKRFPVLGLGFGDEHREFISGFVLLPELRGLLREIAFLARARGKHDVIDLLVTSQLGLVKLIGFVLRSLLPLRGE